MNGDRSIRVYPRFEVRPGNKGAHLSVLELDVEAVVHQALEALVVLVAVLFALLGLDGVERRLVGQAALDRDVTRVEHDVLALLGGHVFGDDDDGL